MEVDRNMNGAEGRVREMAWQMTECHRLGPALRMVRLLPELSMPATAADRMERIEEDYGRMLTYMRGGYDDERRGELYDLLLYRLWQLLADVEMCRRRTSLRSYSDAAAKARRMDGMSHDLIRSVMEKYVTDMTMMSLNDGAGDGEELQRRHYDFINRLFHFIWTSYQWQDGDRDFYASLLASPLTDTGDAVTLTGAVSLGLLECFDLNKLRALVAVWRGAENQMVRQTALVGILLGLPRRRFPFDSLKQIFDSLSGDEDFVREAGSLQTQVLNCMNAENDRTVIEREIMPTLVKNSRISLGSLGLVDDEQSSVEDILHPERQEQIMEEMEEKAMRMMKMQREGADIYFGGFSQAKKAPFFYEMVNWWMPFNMEHPGIPQNARNAVRNSKFLRMLILKGPFCHSDKYSLLVMGAQVAGRMPKETETPGNDEAFMEAEINGGTDSESAVGIRRYYLQNLYRFYKLYDHRADFCNPFDGLFLTDDVFRGSEWDAAKAGAGRKLLKQKQWGMLADLMQSCSDKDGEAWYMLGCALMHGSHRYDEALQALGRALEMMPDGPDGSAKGKILRLQARALFLTGDYPGAEHTYLLLYEKNEDRPTYCLNACVAMMRQGKYAEALKLLYRLDYKHEDNADIQRHIAWAQLMVGKTEKAMELFSKITENGNGESSTDGYLGLGYCHWFVHEVESAANCFRRYCELDGVSFDDLAGRLLDDFSLIASRGMDSRDVYMMADLCRQE